LAALTSTSLPALRLYLDGQALYRRGDYAQSTVLFGRALDLDSTVALAALGLLASSYRTGDWEPSYRGARLAGANRGRLNARDQAYLTSIQGLAYGNTTSYSQMLQGAEEFVAVAPDRAEAYATLAEVLFSYGPLIGIDRAHERSAAAYRKSLAIDSTYAPALPRLPSARSDIPGGQLGQHGEGIGRALLGR
jgi:tetratricopeptide (TPR) repeat protein